MSILIFDEWFDHYWCIHLFQIIFHHNIFWFPIWMCSQRSKTVIIYGILLYKVYYIYRMYILLYILVYTWVRLTFLQWRDCYDHTFERQYVSRLMAPMQNSSLHLKRSSTKIWTLKIGFNFSLQASDFHKKFFEFVTLKVLHWANSELYVDQALINLSNSRNINTQ